MTFPSRFALRPRALATGALLLVVPLLSSCGSESGPSTDQPTSPAPATSSDGPVDFELVLLATRTAVGGRADHRVVALDGSATVEAFVDQFAVPGFRAFVRRAAARADVPSDRELFGSVVSIGCESPTEVLVTREQGQIVIRVPKSTSPPVECFAPMTTVALITVPN